MKRLVLPLAEVRTRRLAPHPHGHVLDLRRTLRASMKGGGDFIDLRFMGPQTKPPPIVALLDISGSMSQYSRLFLHFLHALTDARKRVQHVPVRHAADQRHPRAARARPRRRAGRLLGERAGLVGRHAHRVVAARLQQALGAPRARPGRDRASDHRRARTRRRRTLAFEMDRLHRSCRRLIWLNPLLRFEGFEARAHGIKAMLPHVDEFRPVHNLESMAGAGGGAGRRRPGRADPKAWMQKVA